MIMPTPGTRARRLYDIRRSIEADRNAFGMSKAVRDDMIAKLWATGIMDTLDIALACGCRQCTVERVLHRQREACR